MAVRIGITLPSNAQPMAWACLYFGVLISGAIPVGLGQRSLKKKPDVDGLLLGGGADVYPGLYKKEVISGRQYDRARDDLESHWMAWAREEDRPVLAICRGSQLMNVLHGGTLHSSVKEAYEDANYPAGWMAALFYRKRIFIEKDSNLYRATGHEVMRVNSIHIQASDAIGEGLKVVARERNGVVQAIESEVNSFFLGVQFHPELLLYRRDCRNIFSALKQAAKVRKEKDK